MVSVVGWKVCEGSVPHGLSGRMESFSECELKLGREPSISAFRLISNHAPARKKAI